MLKLVVHPDIDSDLKSILDYLLKHSPDAARRFVQAIPDTIQGLRELPGKGSPKAFAHPKLQGTKSWRVNGFKNYLIVYRVVADTLFVEMLVHGARDWRRLLNERL